MTINLVASLQLSLIAVLQKVSVLLAVVSFLTANMMVKNAIVWQ